MNVKHTSVFLLVGLVALLGCTSKTVTEPDVPSPNVFTLESVAAGVTQLQELNKTIKAAFDAGTPHECDAALHQASEILTALPKAATDEGFTAEASETVAKNSKALFEHYMKIHEGFHGHGGAETESETNAYDSVAEGINSAMDALAGTISKPE